MTITIGQFIVQRRAAPDTAGDPYDPKRESPLEIIQPVQLSVPSRLPAPPPVDLSSPSGLPPPPNVTLSTPTALPPPPAFGPEPIDPIPAPPAVVKSIPGALPPPPVTARSVPAALPPPSPTVQSIPAALPPPPNTGKSIPLQLPPPPVPNLTVPGVPVAPVEPKLGKPAELPPPPDFGPLPNAKLPDPPSLEIDSGYAILGSKYSQVGTGTPGDLATDPFLHERQIERTVRLGPAKLAVHALTQVGLFAQNVYGTVWNPAMVDPPPIGQNFIRPALDLGFDGNTEARQIQIGSLVEEALTGKLKRLDSPTLTGQGGGVLASLPKSTSLKRIFENVKAAGLNAPNLADLAVGDDPLLKSAFTAGIIPMKLKGETYYGFHTFKGGAGGGDKDRDDEVYVPVCFTDLRPVGNTYRTVYLRPTLTSLAESLSPEWNKSQYMGRVDPVATYMSTGRSISFSLKLIAFGPEDVRTIYQKLNWLASMVYPEYDANLGYKSGPVVRLRIGDVINAVGTEGARGLPGIIESLDFDYSDKLWELKKGFKVPREIDVSVSFTVLHDVPIGRGRQGYFGGLGKVDDKGVFTVNGDESENTVDVDLQKFRTVGPKKDLDYGLLSDTPVDDGTAGV